jgi:multicomponent Na+:H+ antiporter subunit G
MKEWICALLLVSGSLFMLIAALGIFRFPDLFTRMHAAAKAASFGSGLMLASVAVYHHTEPWIVFEVLLIIFFIFLTAPVAAHMIGRAGYLLKVPLWHKTTPDELREQYDLQDLQAKEDEAR